MGFPGANKRSGFIPPIPALDGIRALAVIAVLRYHDDLLWAPGGFLGVEVFFVLSGFLITALLIQEWEQHAAISLGRFYARATSVVSARDSGRRPVPKPTPTGRDHPFTV